MIHAQNEKVVASLPTAATGATATASLTIDTLGYDVASISVIRASNSSTVFANALKVEEADTDTLNSYSNVTALVLGGTGGFTVGAISVAATNSATIVEMDVDCKAKKRYLKVSYTPGASAVVGIVAKLGRAEEAPTSDSAAGAVKRVYG